MDVKTEAGLRKIHLHVVRTGKSALEVKIVKSPLNDEPSDETTD